MLSGTIKTLRTSDHGKILQAVNDNKINQSNCIHVINSENENEIIMEITLIKMVRVCISKLCGKRSC